MKDNTENKRLPLFEIFLIELILFMLLWFLDPLIAKIFTILVPSVCACVLIISLIAEMLERSKVPRLFYLALFVSIIAPLVAGGIMVFLGGMEMAF